MIVELPKCEESNSAEDIRDLIVKNIENKYKEDGVVEDMIYLVKMPAILGYSMNEIFNDKDRKNISEEPIDIFVDLIEEKKPDNILASMKIERIKSLTTSGTIFVEEGSDPYSEQVRMTWQDGDKFWMRDFEVEEDNLKSNRDWEEVSSNLLSTMFQ